MANKFDLIWFDLCIKASSNVHDKSSFFGTKYDNNFIIVPRTVWTEYERN